MSTSGSFNAADNPCPTTVHTRAALIALRNAGSLRPECHYLSDGPTIGTAGNTSATTVEQHAVSPTELSLEAKVLTSFSGSAWEALYDIDAGTSGTLLSLTDDWLNHAVDEDANAPTVHTQVPWHRGSADFSGNNFDTAVLPGWATAATVITDNDIQGATVDLTGMTGALSVFRRNRVNNGSSVTVESNQATVLQNNISASVVDCQSGAQFGFLNNTMAESSSATVDVATTGRVAISECDFRDNYRVSVVGYTGPNPGCNISENQLTGASLGLFDLQCSGTGVININSNAIRAGALSVAGPSETQILSNTMTQVDITKDPAAAGPLHMTSNQMSNAAFTIGPANAAVDNLVQGSVLRGGTYTLSGPVAGGGRNDLDTATVLAVAVTVAATATAGVFLNGGLYSKGVVSQSRTAGTGSLRLIDCTMLGAGCAVTDSGAVTPAGTVDVLRAELTDSQIGMAGITTGSVQDVKMIAAQLNVSGVAAVDGGTLTKTAVVTGGFNLNTFEILGGSHTLTANNTDVASGPGFSNIT